jgi:hypothetical protein
MKPTTLSLELIFKLKDFFQQLEYRVSGSQMDYIALILY